MNLNLVSVSFLTAGAIFLYAAFRNMYPQDVIREAMGKEPIHGPIVGKWSSGKKLSPTDIPNPNPGNGVPVVTV